MARLRLRRRASTPIASSAPTWSSCRSTAQFRDNVFAQVKNGPLDFQPREPFHPLFGAMPKTPLMAELQITQEYLGQSNHLVYLAPMWKEFLDADTYAQGPGSHGGEGDRRHARGPARGPASPASPTPGSDANWTGHDFAQANWYAFGRLAWDPGSSAERDRGRMDPR